MIHLTVETATDGIGQTSQGYFCGTFIPREIASRYAPCKTSRSSQFLSEDSAAAATHGVTLGNLPMRAACREVTENSLQGVHASAIGSVEQ